MKKKRKQSKAQLKAHNRNWSKGIVMCSIRHFEELKKVNSLSFAEQMKILKCKKILEEIISDWKPVL